MSRPEMTGEMRRALSFIAVTGGYLPGIDPVELNENALALLVAVGWATSDAEGWLVTPEGLDAYRLDRETR